MPLSPTGGLPRCSGIGPRNDPHIGPKWPLFGSPNTPISGVLKASSTFGPVFVPGPNHPYSNLNGVPIWVVVLLLGAYLVS